MDWSPIRVLESDPKKIVRNFKWKRCSILANPNVVATLWKFEIGRKFVEQGEER